MEVEHQTAVDKRMIRCRYGTEYHCIEVLTDTGYMELLTLLKSRFALNDQGLILLSYSYNGGTYVSLGSDRDVQVMFGSQVRTQAKFIDMLIETNVGSSAAGLSNTWVEKVDDELESEAEEEVSIVIKQSKMSDIWKSYIKEVWQQFCGGVNEFRIKLAMYAAVKGFKYQCVKNNPTQITAECKRKLEEFCMWRIHATIRESDGAFVIRTLNNIHTCHRLIRKNCKKELSSKVISSIVFDEVRQNPVLSAKAVKKKIKDVYGFKVAYSTTYYAIEKVKKSVLGDGESSYKRLGKYIDLIRSTNPGSHCVLEIDQNENRFKRVFVAFDACIRGFQICRPLICLDGTHLNNKYKGILLSAVGKDANQGIYPLAFAVVIGEDNDNWVWFLRQLDVVLQLYPRRVSFLSDRNLGLVNSVREVFPNNPYGFCYNHLKKNLESKLAGSMNAKLRKSTVKKFGKAAYATTPESFHSAYNKLVAINPAMIRSFFRDVSLSNWSNMWFEGDRYGDMCTNVVESFNAWVLDERLLPITELLDGIRIKIMRRFAERADMENNCMNAITPEMDKKLLILADQGREFEITKASKDLYEVTEKKGSFVVNVTIGTCTCGGWAVNKIPCNHAVTVFTRYGLNIYPYIDHIFLTTTFRRCYEFTINPVVSDPYEIGEPDPSEALLPPLTSRPPGRPPTRRKRSRSELARQIKCSRCHKVGHNRKTCTEPI